MTTSYKIENVLGQWVVTRTIQTDKTITVDMVVVENCY